MPKSAVERRLQKALLLWHLPESHQAVREALRLTGRQAAAAELLGSSQSTAASRSRRQPGPLAN